MVGYFDSKNLQRNTAESVVLMVNFTEENWSAGYFDRTFYRGKLLSGLF